jgi:hypothetical protein
MSLYLILTPFFSGAPTGAKIGSEVHARPLQKLGNVPIGG